MTLSNQATEGISSRPAVARSSAVRERARHRGSDDAVTQHQLILFANLYFTISRSTVYSVCVCVIKLTVTSYVPNLSRSDTKHKISTLSFFSMWGHAELGATGTEIYKYTRSLSRKPICYMSLLPNMCGVGSRSDTTDKSIKLVYFREQQHRLLGAQMPKHAWVPREASCTEVALTG